MKTLEGNHMMLDIETLSTTPRAVILSVGWAIFNLQHGIVDSYHIRLDATQQDDREISISTLKFWAEQDRELFARSLSGDQFVGSLWQDLNFHIGNWDVTTFWGNPAAFDQVLLEDLFRSNQLNVPWTHRDWRCFRTFMNLADVERIAPVTPHDAESDAIAQAQTILQAYGYRVFATQVDSLDKEAEGWMTT